MIKKNKWMLLITSVVILIPLFVGLILWQKLPETMATHWGVQGQADSWNSKLFAVVGLPAFLLVFHWVCVLITTLDPKSKNIDGKPFTLVLWICPLLSLLCSTIIYCVSLGIDISVELIMPIFMGALFVVIGNYMPKCKPNYSMGIKLPWTLNDEDNWNRTHRLAGRVWVAGGIIIILTSFLKSPIVFFLITVTLVAIPTVYSYMYYRKNRK